MSLVPGRDGQRRQDEWRRTDLQTPVVAFRGLRTIPRESAILKRCEGDHSEAAARYAFVTGWSDSPTRDPKLIGNRPQRDLLCWSVFPVRDLKHRRADTTPLRTDSR